MALTTTSIVVVVSVMAGYALARLRFPGRAILARGCSLSTWSRALMLIPMYLIIVNWVYKIPIWA
ncbi:MAG: hypothetical protein R2932_14375 [Caldilineaceae bacterium]